MSSPSLSSLAATDSPCINVCTLDPATGHCVGCFRHIDEIAGWPVFTPGERSAVLARLPGRRAQFHDRLERDVRRGAVSANTRCSRCGAAFACGAADASRPCWCASYPPVAPSGDAGGGCHCPQCLASAASRPE
jgi:predicted Fe-S protein YdhL (DUF1289 family)